MALSMAAIPKIFGLLLTILDDKIDIVFVQSIVFDSFFKLVDMFCVPIS